MQMIVAIIAAAFALFSPQAQEEPAPQAATIQLGKSNLLELEQRTPLAKRFANGQIMASLGSAQYTSADGINWRLATPGYRVGSWQLCDSTGSNTEIVCYGAGQLVWNPGISRWQGTWETFASPSGARTGSGNWTVSMPGDSTYLWYPMAAFTHNGQLHVTLYRLYQSVEPWRGTTVLATLTSAHLVRAAAPGNLSTFDYASMIGDKSTGPAQSNAYLPLYYANEPRCISVDSITIACILRTSADDDDSNRKLDSTTFFSGSSPTFQDRRSVIKGDQVVASVWSPPLASNLYYSGDRPQPAIVLAISTDAGATWNRRLMGAGLNADLAYDAANNMLMLAYGGLTYPRRGYALQSSTDKGKTWSPSTTLPDGTIGRTTGYVAVLPLGARRFVFLYDLLPIYIRPSFNTYQVYSRIITVTPTN